MIILSQDKTDIINFDNILTLSIINRDEDGYGVFARADDIHRILILGYYKTEERAKEVLQEITFAYANMEMLKIPKIDIHQLIPATEMVRNLCYKMPEE